MSEVTQEAVKAQARKNLMATLKATEGLAEKLNKLSDDIRGKKIDRLDAESLSKVYGHGVSMLNGAIRAVVTQ